MFAKELIVCDEVIKKTYCQLNMQQNINTMHFKRDKKIIRYYFTYRNNGFNIYISENFLKIMIESFRCQVISHTYSKIKYITYIF